MATFVEDEGVRIDKESFTLQDQIFEFVLKKQRIPMKRVVSKGIYEELKSRLITTPTAFPIKI